MSIPIPACRAHRLSCILGQCGFHFHLCLPVASSASDGRTGEAPSLLSALSLKGSSCSGMFLLIGFLPGLSQSPAALGLQCPLTLGRGQGCCPSPTMHSSPTQGFLPQYTAVLVEGILVGGELSPWSVCLSHGMCTVWTFLCLWHWV